MKKFFIITTLMIFIIMNMTRVELANSGKLENAADCREAQAELRAKQLVESMSDEQKVGQLMIIGLQGQAMQTDTLAMLQKYHVGGVILFDRNMNSKEQVAAFTQALQQSADLPLFICLDQEGGMVARMADKLLKVPSAEQLGQAKLSTAKDYAAACGEELHSLGINVNFAPVVDLGLGRGRSYSDKPEQVTKFAEVVCEGYSSANIMYCLKHFPGIGKTKADPHLEPSQIAAAAAQLRNEDIKPFQDLINALPNREFFVMVGHLQYGAFDGAKPASLSPVIMRSLLRQELGFKGLIVTDDLQMGALTKLYPTEELGYRALAAGADIALSCHEYDKAILIYQGILAALQDGRLERGAIDASVKRVIKTKILANLM